MKGYRTPSWFRMKEFLQKKQAKTRKDRPQPGKTKGPRQEVK